MRDGIPPNRKPHVIADVGGMVDETRVSLAIYGDDLDPEAVSAMLACAPSRCHRKGDRLRQTSPPSSMGAWILTVEGRAPHGPTELIKELLGRFPSDPAFWRPLIEQYRVSVRVGIHTAGWNRGFDITAEAVAALARTGSKLGFDLYFYGDEEDSVQ
jgi:Domain of unknown function (DUF4279)